MIKTSFYVNEKPVTVEIKEDATLLYVLREVLGMTGTKEGCGMGDCGACTVLVDGKNVNSCICLAAQIEGCRVLTIEGVEENPELKRIQKAFLEYGAVQCGFCTPGMIMSASALLMSNQSPDRGQIKEAMAGNLCRCTGYQAIIDAVESLAETL